MEYAQPFGVGDPNASYINGNPVAGIEGSIPPAGAIENPQREIVNYITKGGLDTDPTDLMQLIKASRGGFHNYRDDTGPANQLSVSFDPPWLSIPTGARLYVKALHANTSTNVTLQVDQNSPLPVIRANGSVPDVGDFAAGQILELVFDGTNFQIANFRGITATNTNNNTYVVNVPYAADTSVNANTVIASFQPAITTIGAGDLLEVKIANTSNAACQLIVNAITAKGIKNADGTDLIAGQLVAGQHALFAYTGTVFQLLNPAIAKTASSSYNIAKRVFYIDPASHTTSSQTALVEAVRFAYQPVAGNNKVVVDFNTILWAGIEGVFVSKLFSALALQVSPDNGSTWYGPAGATHTSGYPSSASWKVGIQDLGSASSVGQQYAHYDVVRFLGEYTVPIGAPPLLFRVMFMCSSAATYATTIEANATTMQITEYTA